MRSWPRVAVLGCLGLVFIACTQVRTGYERAVSFGRGLSDDTHKLVSTPEEAARDLGCKPGEERFILVKSEVLPQRVKPGAEINHRVEYGYCPKTPTATIVGKLERRILFKGKNLYTEGDDFEFRPGLWVVDRFLTIPHESETGLYALESHAKAGRADAKDVNSFYVAY